MAPTIANRLGAVALALGVLAACGGSDAPATTGAEASTSIASAGESSESGGAGESSDQPSGASAGPSIFEVELPVPSEQTFFDVTDVPPNWPTAIGVPDGLDTTQGFFVDQAAARGQRQLSGTFAYLEAPDDAYAERVLAWFREKGFDGERAEQGEGWFVLLVRGEESASIQHSPEFTKVVING